MAKESKENQVALVAESIDQIRNMVETSVSYHAKATPIFSAISDKILSMLNKEEELKNWEVKDLLKLLDLSGKAQVQPIEKLTALVQSIDALYDKTELQAKMEHLSNVINEFKEKKENGQVVIDAEDVNDIEDLKDLAKQKKKK